MTTLANFGKSFFRDTTDNQEYNIKKRWAHSWSKFRKTFVRNGLLKKLTSALNTREFSIQTQDHLLCVSVFCQAF